jgi:cytidylate kinase
MAHKTSSERLGEALERSRRSERGEHPIELPEGTRPAEPPPMTIALSREAGSNGPAVARAVGGLLGWPVYDHELLERVAAEMGLPARQVQGVDEKRGNWLREAVLAFTSAGGATEASYMHHLIHTLLTLAAQGHCVIVGRGAAQVLPPASTLRVRLVAPEKDRIQAIQQRFGVSHAEAARWVRKTDRERAQFIRTHFQNDVADPRNYDIVLNTGRYPVEECAALIVQALHRLSCRSEGPRAVAAP